MKILVLLSRFPYPLEKGDKLRAYHQLRILSREHDIYLAVLNDKKLSPEVIEKVAPFCKELHILKLSRWLKWFYVLLFFFRGLPLQCGFFYNERAKRKIDKLIKEISPDHIYCQFVRVSEYVKRAPVKKTIDYQDVLSKGVYRRWEVAPFWQKPFFKMEYRRLVKYESDIFSYFDQHTIITAVDRDLIPHPGYQTIHVIPNGVDFEAFSYRGEEKKHDLIFAGNMGYAPNIDAAEYLVKQILPLLLQTHPHIQLVICGANPSYKVKALAGEHVTITGWVDSMADYYARSRIFIAPMRLGTGLQNKLLEAMAMKIPCITSSLAGKPLENIIPGKEILICNTRVGYVEAIQKLLQQPLLREEIAENGHLFVRQNYNWENSTAKLDEIIRKA